MSQKQPLDTTEVDAVVKRARPLDDGEEPFDARALEVPSAQATPPPYVSGHKFINLTMFFGVDSTSTNTWIPRDPQWFPEIFDECCTMLEQTPNLSCICVQEDLVPDSLAAQFYVRIVILFLGVEVVDSERNPRHPMVDHPDRNRRREVLSEMLANKNYKELRFPRYETGSIGHCSATGTVYPCLMVSM
jgi:hypothetical protein